VVACHPSMGLLFLLLSPCLLPVFIIVVVAEEVVVV
jgi:hypothetical protein